MEEPFKQRGPSESAGSKKSSSKKFQKLCQEDGKIVGGISHGDISQIIPFIPIKTNFTRKKEKERA